MQTKTSVNFQGSSADVKITDNTFRNLSDLKIDGSLTFPMRCFVIFAKLQMIYSM